jgi:PAS domain S-box-containing protein
VPRSALEGKLAIVGPDAAGLWNPAATPVDPLFPGVELQATAIDNLLRGDSLWRPAIAPFSELALALAAGLAAIFLFSRLNWPWGPLLAAGLLGTAWAVCAIAVRFAGVLLSPLALSAVLGVSVPLLALLNYREERLRILSTDRLSREILYETESRYQRLVENVNDAIVVEDAEGRLVFANRRFREWFGLENSDIRQASIEQYVAPKFRAEIRDRRERRLRGEPVPGNFEFECQRPDGTPLWIEALVTTVIEDRRAVGVQAALRDITSRKRMEAESLQAQKMESVGRLAGGVAHDFNNLLTVINGYSDLLLNQLKPGDPARSSLEEIRKAGDRAAALTQKLLVFSRKQAVQPKPLNLNDVVIDAEKMLTRLIGEDIDFATALAPDLGPVMADAGQLYQVLMNLVVNARDGMPDGGRIFIETKNVEVDGELALQHSGIALGQHVCLSVTDTGTGMSNDVKEHLFEPFFTTKEPGKGTGLGLATVYGIVRQSSGWIGCTSELGRGSTFQVYLPRISGEQAAEPVAKVVATMPGGTETILVVEDQEAVRMLAVSILEGGGYRVLSAPDGRKAMELAGCNGGTIHLLVTDIVLPYMNGRVLANTMLAERPDLRVLFISGYPEDKIAHRGVLSSGIGFLQKPFTPEALAVKVRQALDGGKAQAAAG